MSGPRDEFDRWIRWARAERDAWRAEVRRVYEESGGVYIEDRDDWYWLVYPSTRPDCRVQATHFERSTNEPRGHYCAESIGELLEMTPPVIAPSLGKDTSKTWRDVSVVRPMTFTNNGRSREATWERWRGLVNMTPSAIAFVLKEWPEAGLSRGAAKAQGVRSGRDSGRALVRMLKSGGRSASQAERAWSDGDWEWARRQVAFISRMRGARGALRDQHGNPTRKLLSLWIWGHDPEKTS